VRATRLSTISAAASSRYSRLIPLLPYVGVSLMKTPL
jgi:hypothetical protein